MKLNIQILWQLHRVKEHAVLTNLPAGAWAWWTHVEKMLIDLVMAEDTLSFPTNPNDGPQYFS
jgi:hypothetical protein